MKLRAVLAGIIERSSSLEVVIDEEACITILRYILWPNIIEDLARVIRGRVLRVRVLVLELTRAGIHPLRLGGSQRMRFLIQHTTHLPLNRIDSLDNDVQRWPCTVQLLQHNLGGS